MSSQRSFAVTARLATATSVLMYALIIIGSVVRTTGSGLACPDWPLCHGQLIPPMQFNIFIEWFHRLIALFVGLLLFATAAWVLAHADTRRRFGGVAALSVVLYFSQALLGALTVWKLLDPSVVAGHLAMGLLLFCTLVTLSVAAHRDSRRITEGTGAMRPPRLLALLGLTTAMVYAQSILGGMVSTNHASLACPDWPRCNGEWFPPFVGLVALQVSHRLVAYALAAIVVVTGFAAARCEDPVVRTIGRLLPRLVLLQIVIGVANVLMGIPVWVSALHLGNAALMLGLTLIATLRVAAMPAASPVLAGVPAR
ncbi:MAG: COX15/CtaA family protein [Candidatus Eisenbacteria bacterium]